MKRICIFHKYILSRRNIKENNKYKHIYKCRKCGKRKVEYTDKRLRY